VTTLAGSVNGKRDAFGTAALFRSPAGVAVNAAGSALYIADTFNHKIRRLNLLTSEVRHPPIHRPTDRPTDLPTHPHTD
jgi:hypothetical protein